jgi:hypothetical protein
LKRIPNGFGIPNPELLNPDFGTGFGIYKSRGIGIGIPLGTIYQVCQNRDAFAILPFPKNSFLKLPASARRLTLRSMAWLRTGSLLVVCLSLTFTAVKRCQGEIIAFLCLFRGITRAYDKSNRRLVCWTQTSRCRSTFAFATANIVSNYTMELQCLYDVPPRAQGYRKNLFSPLIVGLAGVAPILALPLASALAVVLWYHTRLISERLPVRFPAGRTKKTSFSLSPLPLLPHRLMSYFDVWRHLTFRENPHRTQDSIAATRQQLNLPTWRKRRRC